MKPLRSSFVLAAVFAIPLPAVAEDQLDAGRSAAEQREEKEEKFISKDTAPRRTPPDAVRARLSARKTGFIEKDDYVRNAEVRVSELANRLRSISARTDELSSTAATAGQDDIERIEEQLRQARAQLGRVGQATDDGWTREQRALENLTVDVERALARLEASLPQDADDD